MGGAPHAPGTAPVLGRTLHAPGTAPRGGRGRPRSQIAPCPLGPRPSPGAPSMPSPRPAAAEDGRAPRVLTNLRPPPSTAPRPRPGVAIGHQPSLHGITFDVSDDRPQMTGIPDEPIPIILPPKPAPPTQQTVRAVRDPSLPTSYDHTKGHVQRLNQHMDVIGHHAPCQEPIAFPVEAKQRVFHPSRHVRPAKPARTMASVHAFLCHPTPLAFAVRFRHATEQMGR